MKYTCTTQTGLMENAMRANDKFSASALGLNNSKAGNWRARAEPRFVREFIAQLNGLAPSLSLAYPQTTCMHRRLGHGTCITCTRATCNHFREAFSIPYEFHKLLQQSLYFLTSSQPPAVDSPSHLSSTVYLILRNHDCLRSGLSVVCRVRHDR